MRKKRKLPAIPAHAAAERWSGMETLEERQLLSLVVAQPLSGVTAQPGESSGTVDVSGVFNDTQTAVEIDTSQGTFDVLLYDSQTPLTVANFLEYVTNGLYDSTFIHRSVSGFVIQGGGYSDDGTAITTYPAIQSEAGISNVTGTIAMALTGSDVNSATSQWYINTADNSSSLDSQGFTVFGYVINDGMDVVNAINALTTHDYSSYDSAFTDVPLDSDGYLVTVSASEIAKLSTTGASWMTLSVVGNTNPDLVTPTLTGTSLGLAYASDQGGSSTITLRATDMLGNTIDSSFDVNVDYVQADDLTTNQSAPVLTGTVGDGVTALSVTVNSATYTLAGGDVVVNGNDWSLQLPSLADGTYPVSVTATDASSADNTASAQLLVDTTAPAVTIDNGLLPDKINTDTTLTGTFDDANISGVVVTLDDGLGDTFNFDATLDTGAKTWSAGVPIAGLADGAYSVSVTATDIADNSTTVNGAGQLTVDTVADVTVNDLLSNVNTVTLTGTVGADVTAMDVLVGGTDYTWAGGDITVTGTGWSLDLTSVGLADSNYTVVATATDDIGNVNTVDGELLIDTTAPTAAFDDGQLPATINADTTLTGTFVDANISTIVLTVDNGLGATSNFNATIDTTGDTWSAQIVIAGLPDGTYNVSVTAADLAGNAATENAASQLTIDTTAPVVVVSTNPVVIAGDQPGLSGTIDDPTATILVTIGKASVAATNNGDGTWTLAAGAIAAVPDGMYRVVVTATDPVGNRGVSNSLAIIDTTAPVVTVNRLTTTDTSPALSGTINDNGAAVVVTVNGEDYDAVNNGDGTWTLADGAIAALPQGVYDVIATATDALGNAGTDSSANELAIASTWSVTLGASVYKITYVDADGTTVTVKSGKGDVAATFTGVNIAITGTGKNRAVTATGGILDVDLDVVATTASLSFKTNTKGDGLTSINWITGAGTLKKLDASGVDLLGGIQMDGVIQSMQLHNIESDIVMGAYSKGVTIAANEIIGGGIQTDYIYSLKAGMFNDSIIQALTIKTLTASAGFLNTNVTANQISTASLSNVDVDNDDVAFGIQADSIKSLKLKQGKTTLKWNKDFTDGIEDFFVTLV